jgi:hypothetical protein
MDSSERQQLVTGLLEGSLARFGSSGIKVFPKFDEHGNYLAEFTVKTGDETFIVKVERVDP